MSATGQGVDTGAARALRIDGLTMDVAGRDGEVTRILDGVSLDCHQGEIVGLVGESGSGKSMTLRAAVALQPAKATVAGEVVVAGRQLIGADARTILEVRRSLAAMIFQDPRANVNPYQTIGTFVGEGLRVNQGWSRPRVRAKVLQLLDEVGLPDPGTVVRRHPFELSGGMLQRVMIAAALAQEPQLLLADEATTALDVTTQAEIMGMLRRLRAERGLAIVFVTHDLDLAISSCDRIFVMQHGCIVEEGTAREIFEHPRHPYTRRLFDAMPSRIDVDAPAEKEAIA